MIMPRVLAVALLAFASHAYGQYPPRGAPDPAWNGGRLRVVDLGADASGYDVSAALASLSGTRHALAIVRYQAPNDAILIVDTAPERLTTFVLAPPPGTGIDQVVALAPAGSALLIGGARTRADGSRLATLELREIGVDPVPRFESHGELAVASSDPALPQLVTSAVRADPRPTGPLAVWQIRAATMQNNSCPRSTLHRLDHANGAFIERASLDLGAALSRPCLYFYTTTLDAPRPGDPPGAQALMLSGECIDASTQVSSMCVTRVVDRNPGLSVDTAYGTNGLATLNATPVNLVAYDHVADAAGNLLLAVGRGPASGVGAAQLARLRANGALDTSFGSGGFVTVPAGPAGGTANGIALAGENLVQLVGKADGASGVRPFVLYHDLATGLSQFVQVDLPTGGPNYTEATFLGVAALPAGGALAVGSALVSSSSAKPLIARLAGDRETVTLVEYFHAAFGHYFVTALANEIRLLDEGLFAGWRRTGESFAALSIGAAGAADVCRFFSTTFAPKSSHFYTPFAVECNGLKNGVTWTFEGNVFALNTPSASGACPAGTRALHRLYNDGMSGAPNHRYVVRDALRIAQAQQRWVEEGLGSPPVFACVPR